MRPQRANSGGFTLIELMVVVAVVGVLALVVGSAMSRPDNAAAVRRFSHEVLVAMRQARNEAVQSSRVIELSFRSDGQALAINGASLLGPGPPAGFVWQPLMNIQAGTNVLVQAIDTAAKVAAVANPGTGGLTTAPNGRLRFNPDGTATPATVYIRDESGKHQMKVVLFGITGYSHLLPRW